MEFKDKIRTVNIGGRVGSKTTVVDTGAATAEIVEMAERQDVTVKPKAVQVGIKTGDN